MNLVLRSAESVNSGFINNLTDPYEMHLVLGSADQLTMNLLTFDQFI